MKTHSTVNRAIAQIRRDQPPVRMNGSGPTRGIHLFHGPDEPCYRGYCAVGDHHDTMILGEIDRGTNLLFERACGPCIDRFTATRMDPFKFNGSARTFVSTRVTPYAAGEKVVFDDNRID